MIERAWWCIPKEVLSQVLQPWAKLSWPSLQWWRDPEPIEYFSKWKEFCRDSILCERSDDENGLLQNGLLAKDPQKVVTVSSFCFVSRLFLTRTLCSAFLRSQSGRDHYWQGIIRNSKNGDLKNVGRVLKITCEAARTWNLSIGVFISCHKVVPT